MNCGVPAPGAGMSGVGGQLVAIVAASAPVISATSPSRTIGPCGVACSRSDDLGAARARSSRRSDESREHA